MKNYKLRIVHLKRKVMKAVSYVLSCTFSHLFEQEKGGYTVFYKLQIIPFLDREINRLVSPVWL